jgi:integrase/recombinase XerD
MDCFSIAEMLRLLQAAWDEDKNDWLLLAVTFRYALRAAEAVSLRGDSVIGEHLVVKRGKRSKPVREPLWEHPNMLLNVRQPMIELAGKRGPSQKLFPISARTFQRRVHKYGALAGLPKLLSHPHTLKHSIATHLDANGMSTREIMDITGHKSLRSLEQYLHSNPAVSREKYERALSGV